MGEVTLDDNITAELAYTPGPVFALTVVPEPLSLALLLPMAGLLVRRRRRAA
jgi:hypothetical protein